MIGISPDPPEMRSPWAAFYAPASTIGLLWDAPQPDRPLCRPATGVGTICHPLQLAGAGRCGCPEYGPVGYFGACQGVGRPPGTLLACQRWQPVSLKTT